MPVSDILTLKVARLTNQQIADMMLSEDRLARSAAKRGDYAKAREHRAEVDKLSSVLA